MGKVLENFKTKYGEIAVAPEPKYADLFVSKREQKYSDNFKATQQRLQEYQPRADVDLALQYRLVKEGRQAEIPGLAQERKFFDPFHAGTADVVGGVGSAMSWLGSQRDKEGFFDKTGAKLQQYAKQSSEELTDVQAMRELGDFDFKENITNPSWWQHTVMRAVPNILSQAAAAWAGAGIAKVGTTAMKLPKLLSFATKALGGGLGQSALEATLEAGQTYSQALEKFGDKDVANNAAKKVFMKNAALLSGSNTAELALAFGKKVPFLSSAGLFAKGIKLAGSSAMEATEEMLQSKFSTEALGEDFSFKSPEAKEAGTIGAIFGGVMGSFGEVYNSFQSKTIEKLNEETKAEFDKYREVEAKKGVSPVEADTKALEKVIETHPEGVEMAIKESTGVEKPSEAVETKKAKTKPVKSPEMQALDKIKERETLNIETATEKGSTQYGARMKAIGYEYSAFKRALEGKPTVKEKGNARKYLESNYTGKKVDLKDGNSGEVVGTAYGKIRVKLDDGDVKSFKVDDIVKKEVTDKAVLEKIKNDATDKLKARGDMFDIEYDDIVAKANFSEKAKPQEARGEVKKEKEFVSKPIQLTSEPKTNTEMEKADREVEILNDLEIAEAGKRIRGEDGKTIAQKSTFPDWVPKGQRLRRKKLFDAVLKHIYSGTIPTKVQEVRLYNMVRDEINAHEIALEELQNKKEINIDDIDFGATTAEINSLITKNEKLYDEEVKSIEKQDKDIKKHKEEKTKKRISKLAKRLIDNERVNLTAEQSTYNPTSNKREAQKAAEIAIENPEKVIRMAKQQEGQPSELLYGNIVGAALDVVGTKDANLTSEIASAAVKAGTRFGQETNAFKAIRHDTPGYFMMEALRAKMDNVKIDYDKLKNKARFGRKQTRNEAMNKEIKNKAKKVKEEVDDRTANIQSANDIINSILC